MARRGASAAEAVRLRAEREIRNKGVFMGREKRERLAAIADNYG
jgi:hypothetical protein